MDEDGSISSVSRKALIGTLIVVALNPISIFVGYYLSKALAAPKLKIQYANATVQLEPLLLDPDAFAGITRYPLLQNYLDRQLSRGCEGWIRNRKLRRSCIAESIVVVKQFSDTIEFESSTIKSNMDTIANWTADSELVLRPLALPGIGDTPIQSIARQNKGQALELLKGALKVYDELHQAIQRLLAEFRRIEQQKEQRTGDVTVAVGVLNSGDSDGVVFPSATLHFTDSNIALEPAESKDAESKYAIVKAHSFREALFSVDKTKSTTGALEKWTALVKNGNQAKFTINMDSSNGLLVASGHLPP